MGYATLVVQADADNDGKSRIELAMALARQFRATLIGVAAHNLMPPLTVKGTPPGAIATQLAAEEKEINASLGAAQLQFRAVTEGVEQPVVWRSMIDDPAAMLALEARTADLVIVGRQPESRDERRSWHADPGDVLMQAGRPILVVPPGISHLDTAHVVVAWKDSLEARRAVVDALPFLKLATSVLVLQVCQTESEQAAAAGVVKDVAGYLSSHGVAATSEARLMRENSVSAEVLLVAAQHGAELIVAGGYAHSRLQEWVFGGLTRTLLGHFPKCCLLSR